MSKRVVNCYNCGKPGHIARFCTDPPKAKSTKANNNNNPDSTGQNQSYTKKTESTRRQSQQPFQPKVSEPPGAQSQQQYQTKKPTQQQQKQSQTRKPESSNQQQRKTESKSEKPFWESASEQNSFGSSAAATASSNSRYCYNCGSPWHIARNCPEKKKANSSNQNASVEQVFNDENYERVLRMTLNSTSAKDIFLRAKSYFLLAKIYKTGELARNALKLISTRLLVGSIEILNLEIDIHKFLQDWKKAVEAYERLKKYKEVDTSTIDIEIQTCKQLAEDMDRTVQIAKEFRDKGNVLLKEAQLNTKNYESRRTDLNRAVGEYEKSLKASMNFKTSKSMALRNLGVSFSILAKDREKFSSKRMSVQEIAACKHYFEQAISFFDSALTEGQICNEDEWIGKVVEQQIHCVNNMIEFVSAKLEKKEKINFLKKVASQLSAGEAKVNILYAVGIQYFRESFSEIKLKQATKPKKKKVDDDDDDDDDDEEDDDDDDDDEEEDDDEDDDEDEDDNEDGTNKKGFASFSVPSKASIKIQYGASLSKTTNVVDENLQQKELNLSLFQVKQDLLNEAALAFRSVVCPILSKNEARLATIASFVDDAYIELNAVEMEINSCAAERHLVMGDYYLKLATTGSENLDMELVFRALDEYAAAASAAKEIDLEKEAIAAAARSYVFLKVLKLDKRAFVLAKQSIDLALACYPRTFDQTSWYKFAVSALKIKQERILQEEESTRAPIMKALKPQLDKIEEALSQSWQDLLKHIYTHHPQTDPKDAKLKCKIFSETLDASNGKKAILEAIRHYHTDKIVSEETNDKTLYILREEITKYLNRAYERFTGKG